MTELSHPLQTFVEDEVRTYAQRTIAFGRLLNGEHRRIGVSDAINPVERFNAAPAPEP